MNKKLGVHCIRRCEKKTDDKVRIYDDVSIIFSLITYVLKSITLFCSFINERNHILFIKQKPCLGGKNELCYEKFKKKKNVYILLGKVFCCE